MALYIREKYINLVLGPYESALKACASELSAYGSWNLSG